MYRCSKCGHKSRTFAAMAKHARKHGFKRKAKASVTSSHVVKTSGMRYCPCCGKEL